MKILSLFFIGLAASASASCPDPTLDAPRYSATGPELIAPQAWPVDVLAEAVAPCPDWRMQGTVPEQVEGFLPVAPTAVFDLVGLAPHILMVMAQAPCDPLLAVRSPDGVWHFGETANDREEVVVWSASDGPLQVWIGSRGASACSGDVILETFDR